MLLSSLKLELKIPIFCISILCNWQVAGIVVDYKWTLRNGNPESGEYQQLKSEVGVIVFYGKHKHGSRLQCCILYLKTYVHVLQVMVL